MKQFISALLVACLLLCMTACNNTSSIEKDLTSTLNSICSGRTDEHCYLYGNNPVLIENDLYPTDKICQKVDFEIISIEKDKGTAKAHLKITAPDSYGIISTIASNTKGDSMELLLEDFEKQLDGDFITKEFKVTVDLRLINNKWFLVPNRQLSNALSGGLDSFSRNLEIYRETIQKYVLAFPWKNNSTAVIPGLPDASYMYMYHTALSEIGYAFIDVDRNGQHELLIGEVTSDSCIVYDMYTYSNNTITHLFDGGERYSYTLRTDGSIINEWSDSAASSGYDKYTINSFGDQLEFLQRLTYDAWYAQEIGLVNELEDEKVSEKSYFLSNSQSKADYKSITVEEAKKYENALTKKDALVYINYIPLSYSKESEKSIPITSSEQNKLNLFLSNFSEQSFNEHDPITYKEKYDKFDVLNPDHSLLLHFVFIFNNANRSEALSSTEFFNGENGYVYLTVDQINEDLKRFFNITLTLDEIKKAVANDRNKYVDGNKVCSVWGIGETYNHMSVAETMEDLGDGTYKVKFRIYAINDIGGDGHIVSVGSVVQDRTVYSYTVKDAEANQYFELAHTGIARVRPYNYNKKESYQLLEYQIIDNK